MVQSHAQERVLRVMRGTYRLVVGIFAGGDIVNDASVVVEALASGKKAVQGIHAYLQRR